MCDSARRETCQMAVRVVNRGGVRRLVIDFPYRDPSGRRCRYRRDAAAQTTARAHEEERRRLGLVGQTGSPYDDGEHAPPAGAIPAAGHSRQPTLADAVRIFYELYAPTRLKPSTQRGYREVIERLLLPKYKRVKLVEIGATMIRTLDREMAARNMRPSTRRNVQCVLRSVLRFAREQGLLEKMPEWPPLPRVGSTVLLVMSEDEVARVLAQVPERYHLAFALSRFAGLRAGEVRGLRWGDVDLERELIVVRRARCHGQEAPPKSGHQRLVPIHPALRALLDTAPRGTDGAPVTGREPGVPWGESALTHAFSRACVAAGVRGFRLHDLRHWFVTTLFRVGNPAPVVQRLAGHEHLVTTQRYAHAHLDELRMGIARMVSHANAGVR